MIEFIIFFMIETKPDISFVTSIISRFAKNLDHLYTKVVKAIFCYLKGLKD